MPDGMDKKTGTLAHLISVNKKIPIKRLLVVGCGSGVEAAVLAKELAAEVIGIDIVEKFDAEAATFATLQKGDAMQLEFAEASFDFVYSFHALEHIEKPKMAIQEIFRVLKHDGGYIVGTPNRSRWIGYLGSACTWREKIAWNIADWRKRLKNEFRNELGAHAGFTAAELAELLQGSFPAPENITRHYYELLYARHLGALRGIYSLQLDHVILPSVYFLGWKP
jgi:ubiquinone/menaquinone biosynthesis C-methylase UbiE